MRSAVLLFTAAVFAFGGPSAGHQDAEKIYTPGKDGVTHPVVVKEVKPRYPKERLEAKKGAVVTLDCVVTPEGLPSKVRVQTPGDPAFDEAALKALEQWEFKPGTKDGKPVPVKVEVVLTFTAK